MSDDLGSASTLTDEGVPGREPGALAGSRSPASPRRLVDAALHPSGAWSVVGVDATFRVFLARGDHVTGQGAREITSLDALVPPTEGHAELRALLIAGDELMLAGHERGPLTHTGDSDRSLIRSDAWRAARAMP